MARKREAVEIPDAFRLIYSPEVLTSGFFLCPKSYRIIGMDFLQSFVTTSPALAYLVLFLGMFIEGEVFFLTAAIFALEGFLRWDIVLAVTFVGVILGDIVWYFLGRYSKDTRLGTWVHKKFSGYQDWLEENFETRYARLAFISKFLYYVNRLTPLLAGWQKMDFRRFVRVHIMAAAAWLVVMFTLGKVFGLVIDAIGVKVVLHRLYWVFLVLAVIVLGGEHFLRKMFVKKLKRGEAKKAQKDEVQVL